MHPVIDNIFLTALAGLYTAFDRLIIGRFYNINYHEMMPTIVTDRLSLEVLSIIDDEFILELVNSEGWLKFIGNRNVHSKEEAVAYIDKISNTPKLTYWVVRIKTNNSPAGIISFLKRDYLEYYDIGFAFLPEYQRNVYAYEAAKAVLLHVSQYPEHDVILATTIPANTNSIGLLTKLGLGFEREIEVNNNMQHVYSNATLNRGINE